MTIFNTIPDKLPAWYLNDLKKEKYDDVILFALAVFGSHSLEELVNDPSKSINNRMEEKLFHKWAEKLIDDNYIEKYEKFEKTYYKIRSKGKDRVMKLTNNPIVKQVIKGFNELIGISPVNQEIQSKSLFDYKISYQDYIFGLLSIIWRITHIINAGAARNKIKPELKISLGKSLEENAINFANNVAIQYEDIQYTYKEMNERINQYANFFLSLGLKKGDIMNVFLENRPELLFIIGAMSKIGTIASLINTRQRSATLSHSLRLNPVKLYIIGEELYEAFEEVKPNLGLSNEEQLFFLPDKNQMELPNGYIDLAEEVKDLDIKNPPTTTEMIGNDTYAYIFTSGTSGLPKAAPMKNIHMISAMNGWGIVAMHMQPEDVVYISLPLFHSNAIHIGWASALAGGSTIALARRFSVKNFWKDVIKYKVTCFNYIGEICRYLYNQPPSPEERNHRVYKICGNGLRPEIWKEFKERFGIREVYEHYGMTEMNSMFCNYFNLDCTVGFNFSQYSIVKYDVVNNEPIKSDNGFLQEVNEGEVGLVLMKMGDEYIFTGYSSKDETEKKLTRDAFEIGDLWYNTGDMLRNIGYKHAQFVDRLGDTFRWKGENVSTSEIEDIVVSFQQVEHASVYGVEIPGTEGRAGMVSIMATLDHKEFNFDSFLITLKENLPPYAIPKFVRFLAELSTTSTYKIQKFDMKKVGFDINKTSDPVYVLLPENPNYTLLTQEIYKNILNLKYRKF